MAQAATACRRYTLNLNSTAFRSQVTCDIPSSRVATLVLEHRLSLPQLDPPSHEYVDSQWA